MSGFSISRPKDYRNRCVTKSLSPPCNSSLSQLEAAEAIQFTNGDAFIFDTTDTQLSYNPVPGINTFSQNPAPSVVDFMGTDNAILLPAGGLYSIQLFVTGALNTSSGATTPEFDSKVRTLGVVINSTLNSNIISSSEPMSSATLQGGQSNDFFLSNTAIVGSQDPNVLFIASIRAFFDATVMGTPDFEATNWTVEIYRIGNI